MNEENKTGERGRLKVFLGYASGVGKTQKMFDEGRRRKERGQDVVIGALQEKIPAEVEPLIQTLEVVPMLQAGGTAVMNVDAILRRKPQMCLVDSLASDNPPGSRNAHRWQDVEELLDAGISVAGSVNLQYIDDQQEEAERITGKHVAATIPRAFLNTADELVLVDAPTDGASDKLSALREMALVLSAEVIDAGLQRYLRSHGIGQASGTHERFLICLTPNADFDRMIATARRNAARFHCDVLAIYVKHPGLSGTYAKALEDGLAKARAAGAQAEAIEGEELVETVVQYARTHGVTQIFIGHSGRKDFRARVFGSAVSELVHAARGMDVRVFPHR